MAKYYVTFSCGHEERVELFGQHKDRERKIKYYEESGLCPACYAKQKQQDEAKKAGCEIPKLITGKYWNKTVYGRDGYYSVYLDNKKVDISNEEAAELKAYVKSLTDAEEKEKEERFREQFKEQLKAARNQA